MMVHHAWVLSIVLLAPAALLAAEPAPSFERDVLPILTAHCLKCHGAAVRKSGLDLRSLPAVMGGGTNGPVVVKGAADKSLLFQQTSQRNMPPGKAAKLTDAQLAVLRRWIDAGAPGHASTATEFVTNRDRQFWAFRKLTPPATPQPRQFDRVQTPVDAFVLAALEARGLTFSPEADRPTLIRRITFDLIGLPPSPEEVDAFLQDSKPQAAERLIDRLLASPHFGERWGRHWLDEAGYVDVSGGDNDLGTTKLAEGKYHYRDWVVAAFNRDLPFDRFLIEQLAGDELVDWRNSKSWTPALREHLIATGFLRTASDDTDENELNTLDIRHGILQRTGEVVAANLLGLTLNCAKCHDHKFEPISQRDYYRFLAVFAPAFNPQAWVQPKQRALADTLLAERAAIDKHNADLARRVGDLDRQLTGLKKQKDDRAKKQITDLERQRAQLQGQKRTYPVLQVVYDTGPATPTRLLRRGNHEAPGEEIVPGLLSVLASSETAASLAEARPVHGSSGRRLALARRLTNWESPAGALVARVRVNRIWQRLFGVGLVESSDNLGVSGGRPSHPELLEWLAGQFVHDGRLKPLLKTVMRSTAYRQAAVDTESSPAARKVDPENRLLWRQRLRRLEAEAVRDSLLAVSRQLDRTLGGPPVAAENQPDGRITVKSQRRSLYLLSRRNYHPTVLGVFDQPILATNCTRRNSSAVVLQALTLLNDAFVIEQAGFIAARVEKVPVEKRVEAAFRLILGRVLRPLEAAWCDEFLHQQAGHFQTAGQSLEQAARSALVQLCHTLVNTSEFLYVP
jgi:hypothetical protein